jgi:hypothetical protein
MTTNTENTINDNRTEYGFRLSFPKTPFTQNDLRGFKKYAKIPYITVYKRIKSALKTGELVITGTKPSGGRGRPQAIYSRPDAGTVSSNIYRKVVKA